MGTEPARGGSGQALGAVQLDRLVPLGMRDETTGKIDTAEQVNELFTRADGPDFPWPLCADVRPMFDWINEAVDALNALGWKAAIEAGEARTAKREGETDEPRHGLDHHRGAQERPGAVPQVPRPDRPADQRAARPGSRLAEAQARGRLAGAARGPRPDPDGPEDEITMGDAARAWLVYVEKEKARAASTVSDYRNTVNGSILPHFGRDKPLTSITRDDIDDFRLALLERVSRRTAQKTLVLTFGMLKYAKRRRWILENPAEDAERVTLRRRTEFAVLDPADVLSVARCAATEGAARLSPLPPSRA